MSERWQMTHELVDATLTDELPRMRLPGGRHHPPNCRPTVMCVYSNGYIKQTMHNTYNTLQARYMYTKMDVNIHQADSAPIFTTSHLVNTMLWILRC